MSKDKKTTAIVKASDTSELATDEEVPVPELPGIESIEKKLLNAAVSDINRIYAAKSVETACAVGEYLLKTFFDNDMQNFDQWGGKHQTFGELLKMAQGEDSPLHMSSSGLWYSVRILAQVKALPKETAMALPLTHHRMLVPLKDKKKKSQLAKQAVEKGMTSRAFQEEVRSALEEEKGEGNPRGRRPLPVWAKALRRSVKAIEGLSMQTVTKDSFDNYSANDTKKLLSQVDDAMERMKKFHDKITEWLGKVTE